MGRIFLITTLAIIYGSLFPFQFHAGQHAGGPIWVLLHTWPQYLDRFEVRDIAVNIFLYIPFGLFGSLWLGRQQERFTAAAWTIGLALALSFSMEMLQYFDDSRVVGILDVLTNFAGAILGVILADFQGKTLRRLPALQLSSALLLLGCWIAYQLFPVFPQLGIYVARAKLAALAGSLSLAPALFAIVDWLTVALFSEVVCGATGGSVLLVLLMLLLPARLLILGRTFTWSDIAGATAAWILWSTWLRRYRGRVTILAWLAAGTLLARGLAPYHWRQPASTFCWIPFQPLLESDWNSAGLVFFNKSFLYGGAVWLFHQAGYSYRTATLGLAALLAIIEAVQVYLPGRSPEISDPVMLAMLAVALASLDSAAERVPPAAGALRV